MKRFHGGGEREMKSREQQTLSISSPRFSVLGNPYSTIAKRNQCFGSRKEGGVGPHPVAMATYLDEKQHSTIQVRLYQHVQTCRLHGT
ncbi:hypothetical protein TNCV_27871 [Trichonephila clavipes]|uniref:Uncharacterized protein n=1 Tax=Trichonephila clavipes TaxID=2585209 RepID=A0A8X6WLA8_TRICX|nr:hypothetical protein TNCV_27871 [Trichonephila clavipes]